MAKGHLQKQLAAIFACCLFFSSGAVATAQLIKAPLDQGFARSSSIDMSVDEMLGPAKVRKADEPILGPGFPALWIAEIQFKPVRLTRMSVVDPKTRTASRELVWYMVYRIIPRDYTELAGEGQPELIRKLRDSERDPANAVDPLRAAPISIPRFVLHIDDQGQEKTYNDEINLEIQKAIYEREVGRRGRSAELLNMVEAIGEVSEPVSVKDPDPLSKAKYGVAIWRNVDPKTDYFTVYMSGLTNAYRISTDAAGGTVVEEKVAIQKFARPGDEFLQDEQEFRVIDQPTWAYRVRNADLQVPNLETVLRNARKDSPPKTQD